MDRLLVAYQDQRARLAAQLVLALGRRWERLGIDEADIDAFLAFALPLLLAGEAQAGNLANAYLSRRLGESVAAIEPVVGAAVRGVDPVEVYRRPFVEVRARLADGKTPVEAFASGRRRLDSLIRTDLQLASTKTSQRRLAESPKVVGFRRVLTGSESCGLCAVASTQRYRSFDLMPIHPGCDCSVEPIVGDTDPGRVANRQRLRQLKGEGVKGNRSQLSHFRVGPDGELVEPTVAVRDHGELGPTLAEAGHEFSTL